MEYKTLLSVTGAPGLFQLISSKNDGALVKSLTDGSSRFFSNRVHQFSHLESIEIYTTGENVNLREVFQAMAASEKALPEGKDNKALKSYFEEVFPTMDFDRVYMSDMRKMVKWFHILKEAGVTLEDKAVEGAVEEGIAPADDAAAKVEAETEAKEEPTLEENPPAGSAK